MPSLKTYLAAATLIALAAADTIMITATSNNTFSPDSVMAMPGDVLEFHFQSGNHSVEAGDYGCPCFPLSDGIGFSSGLFDIKACEDDKVFRVTLATADTLVFYSSQGDDCFKGMVGIVNPTEKQTLQSYRTRAGQLARCILPVPPGKCCYGEDSVDNTALCSSNDQDIKDNKNDNNNNNVGAEDAKCSFGKNGTSCGVPEDGGIGGIAKSSGNMLQVPLLAIGMGAIVAFAKLSW
ncbi:hypothetical protein E4U21_007080 [Claviceps maximensis]|nr:hypothetical protein E4U21_007080 [Claviceps maximensis]